MTEPVITKSVKWDLNLSLLLTAINIVGATVWWLAMPQRLNAVEKHQDDLELRLRIQEGKSASIEGVMGRIDERTKNIEQRVNEFSFRANGSPNLSK